MSPPNDCWVYAEGGCINPSPIDGETASICWPQPNHNSALPQSPSEYRELVIDDFATMALISHTAKCFCWADLGEQPYRCEH